MQGRNFGLRNSLSKGSKQTEHVERSSDSSSTDAVAIAKPKDTKENDASWKGKLFIWTVIWNDTKFNSR